MQRDRERTENKRNEMKECERASSRENWANWIILVFANALHFVQFKTKLHYILINMAYFRILVSIKMCVVTIFLYSYMHLFACNICSPRADNIYFLLACGEFFLLSLSLHSFLLSFFFVLDSPYSLIFRNREFCYLRHLTCRYHSIFFIFLFCSWLVGRSN